MSDRTPRVLWLTWEEHRRTREIARRLGVPLVELLSEASGVWRYLALAPRTVARLVRERPDLVIVQSPSLVLGALAVVLKTVLGYRLVVDAHNEAVEPFARAGTVTRLLARLALRGSDYAIVTNPYLVEAVEAAGGRALILPDPLPDLVVPERYAGYEPPDDPRARVTLVATYAQDEPVQAIFEAVGRLTERVQLFVTGNPGRLPSQTREALPENVVLTGFLEDGDYVRLLSESDLMIDLSTKEHCLVCGAYESVALGTPMLLSCGPATRDYFSSGVVYTAADPDSIVAALTAALDRIQEISREVEDLRLQLEANWPAYLAGVQRALRLAHT